jgi:hypothetical protein
VANFDSVDATVSDPKMGFRLRREKERERERENEREGEREDGGRWRFSVSPPLRPLPLSGSTSVYFRMKYKADEKGRRKKERGGGKKKFGKSPQAKNSNSFPSVLEMRDCRGQTFTF